MPKRIGLSTLQASTIDILNVIRSNASPEYMDNIPEVTKASDIPAVGEALFGYPALANQFLSALINRIALVRVNSATFNNPFSHLKKGYLEYGETVEEIFVNLVKGLQFDPEKAEKRELKRYLPDVKASFHVINWRVLYPVTIEEEELRRAFLSLDGVTDLISRIVDSIYTAADYDEFLLFKYMIIKAVNGGSLFPVSIDETDIRNAAIGFRGASSLLPFISTKYNEQHVQNNTPVTIQAIFMDALFNAQFDVNILSAAFHMDKADFMGRLHLVDDFTSFDNARFDVIRAESDGLEEVTAAELANMANVLGVLVDEDWFQVYDNLNKFTEKYVASGLRWNYFYHTWKTVSHSPFSNALVFLKSDGTTTAATSLTYTVRDVDTDNDGNMTATLDLTAATGAGTFKDKNYIFVQTEDAVEKLVGVLPYGGLIIPAATATTANEDVDLAVTDGITTYEATVDIEDIVPGATISFTTS